MEKNNVTYRQLDELLRELGFACKKAEPRRKWYEHEESNTVIILTDDDLDKTARVTEIMDTVIHLTQKGLIGEEELEQTLKQPSNGKVSSLPSKK